MRKMIKKPYRAKFYEMLRNKYNNSIKTNKE
jgi:hypothetical protein